MSTFVHLCSCSAAVYASFILWIVHSAFRALLKDALKCTKTFQHVYRKHGVTLGLQPSEDQCALKDDPNNSSHITSESSQLPASRLDEVSVGVMMAELAETSTDATQPELLSSTLDLRTQQCDPSIERIIQNIQFLLMLTE